MHHPCPHRSPRRSWRRLALLACVAIGVPGICAVPAQARHHRTPLRHVRHVVVLYLENHSFDNLYGTYPGANGLSRADRAHTRQVDLSGNPLKCLAQVDPHLTSPPLPADACSTAKGDASTRTSSTRRSTSTTTSR